MNFSETSEGKKIAWNDPDPIESMEILRDAREKISTDPIGAKIDIMKRIKGYIDFSTSDYKSMDEINKDSRNTTKVLSDIADEILKNVSEVFLKKS